METPNYVMEFMKEMQKPLTSTKIQNSAYMLQTKEQGFPKGIYKFEPHHLLFMNSPRLTLEMSELENFNYLTEDIQNGQRLFSLNQEHETNQNTFDKRYTNFIKNHLDNIELVSLNTFLKNKNPKAPERYFINKTKEFTGIRDERKLKDSLDITNSFWYLK